MFEEEHPLAERESQTGTRNITLYHTAGNNPQAIREQVELTSEIYKFTMVSKPEKKTWNEIFEEVESTIAENGEH